MWNGNCPCCLSLDFQYCRHTAPVLCIQDCLTRNGWLLLQAGKLPWEGGEERSETSLIINNNNKKKRVGVGNTLFTARAIWKTFFSIHHSPFWGAWNWGQEQLGCCFQPVLGSWFAFLDLGEGTEGVLFSFPRFMPSSLIVSGTDEPFLQQ